MIIIISVYESNEAYYMFVTDDGSGWNQT